MWRHFPRSAARSFWDPGIPKKNRQAFSEPSGLRLPRGYGLVGRALGVSQGAVDNRCQRSWVGKETPLPPRAWKGEDLPEMWKQNWLSRNSPSSQFLVQLKQEAQPEVRRKGKAGPDGRSGE
jgi:hypothetical protein